MAIEICECMYTQDDLGQSVCGMCKGDIYACECSLTHTQQCDREVITWAEGILLNGSPLQVSK